MERTCSPHKEKVIAIANIGSGKIKRLEIGTQQLKFFYEHDEKDDVIIVYMSLPNSTHERTLFVYLPDSADDIVERVINRFVAPPISPFEEAVKRYVEEITTDITRQAKIEEELAEGLVVKLKYRREDKHYYVHASATGYYRYNTEYHYEKKYMCYAYEQDYVNEEEIKPHLMSFALNATAIASTCIPT